MNQDDFRVSMGRGNLSRRSTRQEETMTNAALDNRSGSGSILSFAGHRVLTETVSVECQNIIVIHVFL